MKGASGFKKIALQFLALSFVTAGMVHSSAAAITEGDYCWKATITNNDSGSVDPTAYFIMRFHIVPLGDGTTFSIAGKVAVLNDNPMFATGIGMLASPTSIVANLTASQSHVDSWRDTGVIRLTLNPTTMRGTFYDIGHDFDVAGLHYDQRYTSGTLVPRTCP